MYSYIHQLNLYENKTGTKCRYVSLSAELAFWLICYIFFHYLIFCTLCIKLSIEHSTTCDSRTHLNYRDISLQVLFNFAICHSIVILLITCSLTDTDDCTPNPCNFGGNCTDKLNAYECTCWEGTEGESCEISIP